MEKILDRVLSKINHNKIIILLLIVGAVYFFLKFITPLLAPALLAMLFVTVFGQTLQKWQKSLHIHRQIGAVILLILACVIVFSVFWILGLWIVGSLPGWIGGLDALEQDIAKGMAEACEKIGNRMGVDGSYLENMILEGLSGVFRMVRGEAVPEMLTKSIHYMKQLLAFVGFGVTFLVTTVFLAKDYDNLMNWLLDREECHLLLTVVCGVIQYIATFVRAQLIILTSIAILCGAGLALGGIHHGAFWGILAGLLDVLPFVGTGVVLLPLGLLQLFGGSYGRAFLCIVLYILCIFIRELLEPKLIGKRMGVSPIGILLSLYAGIKLFGVIGLIQGPLGFIIIDKLYGAIVKNTNESGS